MASAIVTASATAVAAPPDLPKTVAKRPRTAPPPPGATQISAATATDANAASVPEAVALHASQSLTVLSLEAHVSTAGFVMILRGWCS